MKYSSVTKSLAAMSINLVVVDEDSVPSDSSFSTHEDRVGAIGPAGKDHVYSSRKHMHRRNRLVVSSTPTVVPLPYVGDKHLGHRRNLALTSNEYERIFAFDAAVIHSSA